MGIYKDETELLLDAVRGENKAFELIVEKYQSLICAITLSATNNLEKSEELAQQVFVNAWQNLNQLRDLTKFRSWLCSIARNVINHALRDQKRDLLGRAMPMDENVNVASQDNEPAENVSLQEQQKIVASALSHLSQDYRQVLVLFYREEKSIKAVAEQLALSEAAVKTRLSRGREMLKEHIESTIEKTLTSTKPGKAFTAAVMAGIVGIGVGSSSAAQVIGAGAKITAVGSGAAASGIIAKIFAVAAAVVVIGGGTFVGYKYLGASGQATQPKRIVQITEPAIGTEQTKQATSAAAVTADVNAEGSVASSINADTSQTELPKKAIVEQQEKFAFEPNGVLSGLITDAQTGMPVKDAMVSIFGASLKRQVDSNGFYSFKKLESGDGIYRIMISSTDYVGTSDLEECPQIELKNASPQVKHFALERACKIAIKVTDERGKPIAGAHFYLGSVNNPPNKSLYYPQVTTDANGFAIVDGIKPSTEPYQIVAIRGEKGKLYGEKYLFAPGYINITMSDPNILQSASIVLEDGVQVRGYAAYEDGAPASDLYLVPTPGWWRINVLNSPIKIDPNGYFAFEHIIPDSYKISAVIPYQDDGTCSGHGEDLTQVELPPDGNVLTITVPMKSPQNMEKITGKMRFVNGRPGYVNVNALCQKDGPLIQSAISVQPSSEEAEFVLTRLEPGTYQVTFNGEVEDKTIKDIKVPGPQLDVELVNIGERVLKGIVIDAANKQPVKNFRARLSEAYEQEYSGLERQWESWVDFSSENGKFSLKPISSGKLFYVEVTDGNGWGKTDKVNIDEQIVVEFVRAGSVRGIVVDENGKGIDGAIVTAGSQISLGCYNNIKQVSETGSTKTAGGGIFAIRNLPCGKDSLKVTHPDYCSAEVSDIEIKAGQATEDVKISLHRGATVEGYVYDETGEPAAGIPLRIYSSFDNQGDPETTAITDANGFYRIANLPEQMRMATRKISGNELGVIQRNFMPAKSAAVRLDFGGKPVVHGKLALPNEDNGYKKLILSSGSPYISDFICIGLTNADGSFSFNGVPAGKYSIYIERDRMTANVNKLADITTSGQDQNIGVIPGQDTGTITVHLQHGSRVTLLHLWQRVPGGLEISQYIGVTDADSPQVFKNVPAGDYKITAFQQQNRFKTAIPVQVNEAGKEIVIELPHGDACIHGKIYGSSAARLSLINADETILAELFPGENGSYKIDNLPAGHYTVQYMIAPSKKTILREFDLGEGSNITVDLEAPAIEASGTLLVYVADAKGLPIRDADVRVEGNGQTYTTGQQVIGVGYSIEAKPGNYILKVNYGGTMFTQNVTIEELKPNSISIPTVSMRLDK